MLPIIMVFEARPYPPGHLLYIGTCTVSERADMYVMTKLSPHRIKCLARLAQGEEVYKLLHDDVSGAFTMPNPL